MQTEPSVLFLASTFKDHQQRHLDLVVVIECSVCNSVRIATHLIIAMLTTGQPDLELQIVAVQNICECHLTVSCHLLYQIYFVAYSLLSLRKINVTILTKRLQKIHAYWPSSIGHHHQVFCPEAGPA